MRRLLGARGEKISLGKVAFNETISNFGMFKGRAYEDKTLDKALRSVDSPSIQEAIKKIEDLGLEAKAVMLNYANAHPTYYGLVAVIPGTSKIKVKFTDMNRVTSHNLKSL